MIALKKLNLENVVFIDIETAPLVKELELDTPLFTSWEYKKRKENLDNQQLIKSFSEEAALYPEFAKIVCISIGRVQKDKLSIRSYNNEDEKELLTSFINDFQLFTDKKPKTVLCGHAILGFDIPFIFKRCIINQIPPNDLLDSSDLKPWEMTAVDTNNLWKGTMFTPSSLMSIAIALGIDNPKDDISGADVPKLYWSDDKDRIKKITTYCEKDVLTVANVVRKCRFEPLLTSNISTEMSVEDDPLLLRLYNGARYTAEDKKQLIMKLNTLSEEELEKAFEILDTIATNKNSKFTENHLNELEDLL